MHTGAEIESKSEIESERASENERERACLLRLPGANDVRANTQTYKHTLRRGELSWSHLPSTSVS